MEKYIYKDNKKLRYGYTTGSCASAATKAAVWMLLKKESLHSVNLMTPKGWLLTLDVEDINVSKNRVICAIRKDAGDDPDVTDNLKIYAEVSLISKGINISGGEGIGTATKPGLQIGVGESAINPVPLEMIRENVLMIADEFNYSGGFDIEISAPGGKEIAKKTFNEKLGIIDGISILGTSGIVEPMSEKALISSIFLEMNILNENGVNQFILCPGNFGWRFAEEELKLNMDYGVKISNFIGDSFESAKAKGIKRVLFVSHLGKGVKVAGGIMNTHSRNGDCRMEIIASHSVRCGASCELLGDILDAVSTDAAVEILYDNKICDCVLDRIANEVEEKLKRRVYSEIEIGVVLFSFKKGFLTMTENAKAMIGEFK